MAVQKKGAVNSAHPLMTKILTFKVMNHISVL